MLFRVLKEASSYLALGITIGVFIITLLQIYITSLTGPILSGFYTSISSQNVDQFKEVVIKACLIISTSALIDAFLQGITSYFAWLLRRTLNNSLHLRYFENINYYRIQSQVDNSDQRISHDITQWTNNVADFTAKVIMAPCTVIYYSVLTATYIDWYAPLIIYAWFILGYIANGFLIKYLSGLIYLRDAYEGNFRYNHARIRNNSETLALSNGGSMELEISTSLFNRVMAMGLRIIKWQFLLNIISNFFTYLITILNYVIVAIPVLFLHTKNNFASESDISAYVAKATFDAISLASGLSLFLNLASLLSDLIGFSNRLGTFIENLNEDLEIDSNMNQELYSPGEFPLIEEVTDRIELRNVTIQTPTRPGVYPHEQPRCLIENLSFTCSPNNNLLIMGCSGIGKSSIQRVLSGIWKHSTGVIYRPSNIYYLPANPYFPRAILSLQITYPSRQEITGDVASNLLDRVGLIHLFSDPAVWVTESESSIHWTETLSNGERQRLAFARLLYHAPTFAVLDESTSALPEEAEAALYQQCQQITLISIGHRDSLRQFHPQVLTLST